MIRCQLGPRLRYAGVLISSVHINRFHCLYYYYMYYDTPSLLFEGGACLGEAYLRKYSGGYYYLVNTWRIAKLKCSE